jgi:hypothetical protein
MTPNDAEMMQNDAEMIQMTQMTQKDAKMT